METRSVISGAILPIAVFLLIVSFSGTGHAKTLSGEMAKSRVGQFQVHFLPLSGVDSKAAPGFVAEGLAYSALLSSREVRLGLKGRPGPGGVRTGGHRVSMTFVETGRQVRLTGQDDTGAVAHFLMGDPKNWVRNVPLYGKVRYQEIWPGIDAVFYGQLNNLEFDFILKPGADLNQVKLRFSGVDDLCIDSRGQLVIKLGDRELPLSLPRTYQAYPNGKKDSLGCRFVKLGSDTVGFEIQNHDPALALVIDPIFHFSTYLGGGENWYVDTPGYTEDFGLSVDIDNDGNVYATGVMESSEFPDTSYPYPGAWSGWRGIFICKFDPDGHLLYSTRVHANRGTGITVDAIGQIYVVGDTSTDDFPVVGGFQDFPGSTTRPAQHGFLMKLNAEGNTILYSTFIGGDLGQDKPYDIAIDTDGCAYVVGSTHSSDFITRNPLMENMTRPVIDGVEYIVDDVFVAKIDTNASGDASLLFATTLGGTYYDHGFGIDIDGDRNIYIAGETKSKDFQPMVGALQDTFAACQAGFLVKINAACDRVVYSTFLSEQAAAYDVAAEDTGHAYVVGSTVASDLLPGLNGFKEIPLDVDPFLARVNTHLTGAASLVYATYLGGTLCDEAHGVVTNGHGRVYVTGWTNSTDLPGAPDSEPINGRVDAFYSHIDTNEVGDRSLIGAAYVGGSLNDKGHDVALGPRGEIAITGETVSNDFPTEAAYQEDHADGDGSGRDGFLSKIEDFHYWALPVTDFPDGSGTFWFSGSVAVRVFGRAEHCRPVGLCRKNRNQLSLSVGLPIFEKEVDVYLSLQHKKYSKLFYFINENDMLAPLEKTAVPWRKSTNGSLKAFKSQIVEFKELPSGDWDIALTVAPAGSSMEKAIYRWETETGAGAVQTDPKLIFNPVAKSAANEELAVDTAAEENRSDTGTGGCFLSSLL